MSDNDERPWLAVDDRDAVRAARRAAAASRAEELRRFGARLAAGYQLTEDDMKLAKCRAEEAHIHSRTAHLAAAGEHRRAAEAHELMAETHSDAAAHGIGDTGAHLEAVTVHRVARDYQYRAAEQDRRLAERE